MTESFFGLRRVAPIALSLVVALVLVACGGGNDGASAPAASAGGAGGDAATVENGAVEITAESIAFNVTTIEATAGEAFTVTLVNNDSAPHNFSVYTEEGGDAIVQGDVFDPGDSGETEVPALEPGEYFFVCDLHPNMKGTLVVTG